MSVAVRIVPLVYALSLAFNAMAQEHPHHHQATPVPQVPQPALAPAPPAVDDEQKDHDHAAMQHPAAASSQPAPEVDHSAMGHGAAPPTPPAVDDATRPPYATPVPTPTDAERAAAVRPAGGHSMGDYARNTLVLIDRLEAFDVDGESGVEWEAEAWIGTDRHKLWLRSEGERVGEDLEDADLEVLYGRAVAPWWDVVAGVRHHFEPGQAQDMAVLGVMGVAPYKFEMEASLYLGESGYSGARLEVEYEALLTNRLILQPSVEVNVHGQDDRAHGNGQGLGMIEAGLRLRYEVTRRFAPYVGLVHQRAYGRTADFRREAGEDANDTRLVAGLRIWF